MNFGIKRLVAKIRLQKVIAGHEAKRSQVKAVARRPVEDTEHMILGLAKPKRAS